MGVEVVRGDGKFLMGPPILRSNRLDNTFFFDKFLEPIFVDTPGCLYILTVRNSWFRALPFFLFTAMRFAAQWIRKSLQKDLRPFSLHLFKVLKRNFWGKSMPGHHV